MNNCKDNTDWKLEKLNKMFDSVIVSRGDEELISNINDEYEFDSDDIIFTDGFIVQGIVPYVMSSTLYKERGHLVTSIRGGSYLIVASRMDKEYQFNLYVNRNMINKKYYEIILNFNKMKENIDDSIYYIDHWRSSNVKNDVAILL